VDWEERFSKAHPLNSKIKDTDIFLHATSMKKYLAIQSKGLLLKEVPQRNYSISQVGVYFEKYAQDGTSAKMLVDLTLQGYCNTICRSDHSKEGVVLQIKGRELKKLGCPIYADWNKPYPIIRDVEWIPMDVDYDAPVLSIIVVDCDIPLEYLELVRKVPFKERDML
jgi:hypothetical protein